MAKQNNTILLVLGLLVGLLLFGVNLGLFTIGEASMTRSVPSTVQPGQQFNVIYTTTASDKWGASIVDTVSGGCKFPDGSNQLKTVMLSTEGGSKTIKVIAPSSGSCTFSGDYKFGTEVTKDFIDNTITISTENGNGNGNGEETVCCRGTGLPSPSGEVQATYWWTTTSECKTPEGITDIYNVIVDDSYCENGDGNGNGDIVCTLDVKLCPDGTYVGRIPPDCNFAECPSGNGFDLNQVLFKIGDFEVTLLMFIIAIVALILLLTLGGRRR